MADIQAQQITNGDSATYKQLFSTWYEPLCRYACSITHSIDEAEDIVQRVFCKLWDQRNELAIQTSVKSYLYRAVHNGCMNRIKQVAVRAEHNKSYAYLASSASNSASDSVTYSELKQRVAQALDMLPAQCKRVFEMSRIQQKSYAEIAAALGISTNTVENHIAKALKLLRKGLKEFLAVLLLLFANNI